MYKENQNLNLDETKDFEKREIISKELKNVPFNVVMSNKLIEACYQSNTNEQKLIQALIAQIRQDDKILYLYEFSVEQLSYICNFDDKNIKRTLDDLAVGLMDMKFTFFDSDAKTYYHWFRYVQFTDKTFTVRLSDDLVPFLLELKKEFTTKRLEFLQEYTNPVSMRLDLLFTREFKKSASGLRDNKKKLDYILIRKYNLTDLKTMFGYKKRYSRNNDFYKTKIEPALDEIRRKKSFEIEVEFENERRKNRNSRDYVVFSIKLGEAHDFYKTLKEKIEKETEKKEKDKQNNEELKRKALYEYLRSLKIEEEDANNILEKFSVKEVAKFIKLTKYKISDINQIKEKVLKKFLIKTDDDFLDFILSD